MMWTDELATVMSIGFALLALFVVLGLMVAAV